MNSVGIFLIGNRNITQGVKSPLNSLYKILWALFCRMWHYPEVSLMGNLICETFNLNHFHQNYMDVVYMRWEI